MKKILVIHNTYQVQGGEDIAVRNEIEFLKKEFNVETIFFNNKIDSYFKQLFYFIMNKNYESIKTVKEKIKIFEPDIIYVHNTWFKASAGIFDLLKNQNIKVLIKLHNFRYRCTNSYMSKIHFKGKTFCECCGLSSNEIGIFNKYFKESFLKSFLVIRYGKKFYKLMSDEKFKLLVLTSFHKEYIESNDISKNVEIFRNYINSNIQNTSEYENYFVYAGRISKEKGVLELIESFLAADLKDMQLKIIGDGPALNTLKNKFKHKNVLFLGKLSNFETIEEINNSVGVVTTTKLLEGQPTLLCEASILKKPSIFPKTGGIHEFFPEDYELSYKQFDYQDLISKFKVFSDKENAIRIGNENYKYIKNLLDERSLLDDLMKIIDE
tara:strand:+ start:8646 stop:9788 length:1143 start_codon:yes stop_codon:yes gene_type:complete